MADSVDAQSAAELQQEQNAEEQIVETMKLHVKLPNGDDVTIEIPVTETASEIRLYLSEQKDSWFITSYHLEAAGKRIDEAVPVADLSDLKDGSTITVVEEDYDERAARFHVARVRDIISLSATHSDAINMAPSVVADLSDEKSPFEGFKLEELPTQPGQEPVETPILTQYFPKPAPVAPKCVHRIAFSGFNAPPGNRRFQGDLFYLDVTTLEGETLCITASSRGFFVNNSKLPNTNGSAAKFDPTNKDTKNGKIHRTLVQCLSSNSTQFSRLVGEVSARVFERSAALDAQAPPFPLFPWVAKPRPHEHDVWRAEDSLKHSHELDILTGNVGPDWNEELQSFRELPRNTIEERIQRDSQLFRFHTDFVDVVTRGAQHILNGAVAPLNPNDEKKAQMFLYNNIFYFYPTDNQDLFKEHGGDEAAYKNLRNDLNNLGAFKEVDPEGLHTMEMAVVEYRGQKLVGHTLIPGLLNRITKGEEVVVYGSADNKKVADSEEYAALVREKLAKAFHLAEYKVKDRTEEPKEHSSIGTIELKGVEGTDKRKYLIDFSRMTPRDVNYNSKPSDVVCVLRPELIQTYFTSLIQEELFKKSKAEAEADAAAKKEGKEPAPKNEEEEDAKFNALFEKMQAELVFCNDLFTEHQVVMTEEQKAAAEARIQDIARFLREDVVSMFVLEATKSLGSSILEGDALCQSLHARGINLRYLGAVAKTLAGVDSPFRDVFLREMIVRAAKKVFSAHLSTSREYELANKTAEFLNAFFGRPSNNPKGSRSGLSPVGTEANAATTESLLGELTHSALWARIRSLVESKFNFQLPEWIPSAIFDVPTLRLLCLRNGIRLESRQYDLALEKPFEASNIHELVPIVKHRPPRHVDASNLMEQGQQYIESGQYDKAHDAFFTALQVLQQVYGPIHRSVAECHSILSHVLQKFTEMEAAWAHQQSCTTIMERVTGVDSRATANAYGNLALVTRKVSRPALALTFIRRAIFLTLLGSGSRNPEMWNLFVQYSETLSEAGKKEEAVEAAKRAVLHAEPYMGPSHPVMAQLLHSLALRLSAVHSFREALAYEKKSNAIKTQVYGEKHEATVESNMWLQKLTKMAVQSEIDNTKKKQPGAAKPASTVASTSSQQQAPALHNLPLAQLVQYINSSTGKRGAAIGGSRGRVGAAASSAVRSVGQKPSAPAPSAAAAAAPSQEAAAQPASKKQQKKKAAANGKSQ